MESSEAVVPSNLLLHIPLDDNSQKPLSTNSVKKHPHFSLYYSHFHIQTNCNSYSKKFFTHSTKLYIPLHTRKKEECFSYYRINKLVNKTYILFSSFRINKNTTLQTLNTNYTRPIKNTLHFFKYYQTKKRFY